MADDFYDVLGVSHDASEKEIRQTYRRLARKFHPDVNPGDEDAVRRFKDINRAYEVLSDAGSRAKYDRYGDQWEHADQIEEMQKRRGGGAFRFDSAGGLGDLGGIFGSIFRQQAPQRRRGADIEHPIEVTLEEAFHGTSRTLQFAGQQACATCGGSGQIAGAGCHVCQGSGLTQKERRLEVKIPPGVDSGSRVRIAGEGQAGTNGGKPGSLYLIVSIAQDERFERNGSNLYTDVEVPLTDAVLGAEVEVPTMTGKVALTVPPLSPNGKSFRLGGQGMPKLKGKSRGNLYARLQVKLPEKLSDDDKKLFEQLREAGI